MIQPLSPARVLVALSLATLAPVCRAQDSVLVGDAAGSRIVKFAYPSGTPLCHFVGAGVTALRVTGGMAYGPDGNLYIASQDSDAVLRVNGQNGEAIGTTFVAPGAGGLSNPRGITFGADGRLYVASFITNSIESYSGTTGAHLSTFVAPGAGGLDGPQAIVFFGGSLYVCSFNNNRVLRYNALTGAFIAEVITAAQEGTGRPRGVVFDGAGRMYVANDFSDNVMVKDPVAGVSVLASVATIPGLQGPSMLTLSPTGELLVPCTASGTVERINRLTGASLGAFVASGGGGLSVDLFSIIVKPNANTCYANCDNSTAPPILNINDFQCFVNRFASGCT